MPRFVSSPKANTVHPPPLADTGDGARQGRCTHTDRPFAPQPLAMDPPALPLPLPVPLHGFYSHGYRCPPCPPVPVVAVIPVGREVLLDLPVGLPQPLAEALELAAERAAEGGEIRLHAASGAALRHGAAPPPLTALLRGGAGPRARRGRFSTADRAGTSRGGGGGRGGRLPGDGLWRGTASSGTRPPPAPPPAPLGGGGPVPLRGVPCTHTRIYTQILNT